MSWAVLYLFEEPLVGKKKNRTVSVPVPHISETHNLLPGLVLNQINLGSGFCFNFEIRLDSDPVFIIPHWYRWLTSFPGLILKKITSDSNSSFENQTQF
jgi:hypothetical protein